MQVDKNKFPLTVLLVSIFFIEIIRTAWISDDAAITLRTVLNFTNGFGPVFNVGERVQAYTHPLWFFLLSGLSLLVANVFTAAFLLSICVSVFAFWLLLTKVATNVTGAMIAGAALVLSKAYVDFATSGLENPLSHLLILVAVLLAIRVNAGGAFRDLLLFFLSCSLIYLNRPDLLALMFPLAVFVALAAGKRNRGQLLRAVALGALPVVAWTLFSLYYYGFPFPNTAYAKLGTGIALDERLGQGLVYLLHSIGRDPVTVGSIGAGIVIGLLGTAVNRSIAIGMALYLCYIMSIGGDFMEGRFFTAPLLAAAIVVARCSLQRPQALALGGGVLVLGLTGIGATLLSNAAYNNEVIYPNGIADERGYYYQRYGLLTASRAVFKAPDWVIGERKTGVTCGGLGYNGIINGPGVHYIDECALADPLLARLPAREDPNWRIGHFTRQLPTNYRESIAAGKNLLADAGTRDYYEALRTVTHGPLNAPERLRQIVRFNTGKIARPDWEMYRRQLIPASLQPARVDDVRLVTPVEGGAWDAKGNVVFDYALEVALGSTRSFSQVDLSADHNDVYRVDALTGSGWQEVGRIGPHRQPGMARYRMALDKEIVGATMIRVTALSGDKKFSVGHLLLK